MNTTEVPVRYHLDVNGDMADAMLHDAPRVLMDILYDFDGFRGNAYVGATAQLLLGEGDTLKDRLKRTAFSASGALALAAFTVSDMPPRLRHKTLSTLLTSGMPAGILGGTTEQTHARLEEAANEGHASHPEFRLHWEMAMQYYTEATQDAEIGRMAFCGAGLTIHQLDKAWNKVREFTIDEICRNEEGLVIEAALDALSHEQ